MLTIIYPYRNRDVERIEKSLTSLKHQTDNSFKVYFVDYGSLPEVATLAETLVNQFSFVTYKHYPVYQQPWNKSRALNSVIKQLNDGYCFVADIDMIFHPDFVKTAISLQNQQRAVYFKVGFLNKQETKAIKAFDAYQIAFESTDEATGLTMFPVKALHDIKGFDEFYHFWGAEDTDVHVRLKHAGYTVNFFDTDILLLHQWHESYRSKESKVLSDDLRLTNVVKLNQQHLLQARANKATKVNSNGWGNPLSEVSFNELQVFYGAPKIMNTQKEIIDHFLFCELSDVQSQIAAFVIKYDNTLESLKHKLKKVLNKTVPHFYSLKQVNDLLLTHIISLYRDCDYMMEVDTNEETITLKIRKP